ncbi:MAG: SUMF1/EgtB/PvdO family nonheme iron enzyme [Myxococcota bacterium]
MGRRMVWLVALCTAVAGFAACDDGDSSNTYCAEASCGEHGTCAEGASGPVCVCESGYTSSDGGPCEVVPDACDGVSCGGHGQCVEAEGGPACLCDSGYAPDDGTCVPAGQASSACEDVTCGDHGSCVVTGAGEPLCVCDPGYYRSQQDCVENVDPCSDNDCSGQGACVVTPTGPTCVCGSGYVADGADCEPDPAGPCESVDCSGHGTCVAGATGAVCVCDSGYQAQGTACVAQENPCEGVACSDHGGCVVAGGEAKCLCDAGYQAVGTECVPSPEDALPVVAYSDVSTAEEHPETGLQYVPNVLLVYAVEDHDADALTAAIEEVGGVIVAYQPKTRRYIVHLDAGTSFEDFEKARASLEDTEWVSLAVEEILTSDAAIPPGTYNETSPAGDNRHLEAIRAPSAWQTTRGAGTRVGVIDTGFTLHEDLADAVVATRFAPLPGPASLYTEHGTEVTGLVAAGGTNDLELPGVAPEAEVYYCQHDGLWTTFFYCMDWLLDRDVRVINYSAALTFRDGKRDGPWDKGVAPWDDPESKHDRYVAIWTNELKARLDDGKWLLVDAAGNEALQTASYATPTAGITDSSVSERIVVVGATDFDLGELACYSNQGGLDVVAPGGDEPCYTFGGQDIQLLSGGNGTAYDHGTSLSAPLVTGAAALVWSVMPDWSAGQVRQALLTGSQGTVDGASVLDVAAAVQMAVAACEGTIDPATGECTTECIPDCDGKACGAADGCGGLCTGAETWSCDGDVLTYCTADGTEATADCAEDFKKCGPDPATGTMDCVAYDCEPACSDAECGPDGCGGTCGPCGEDETCDAGVCTPDCVSDCSGLECGGDGCGGSCGTCGSGETCDGGLCVETTSGCWPDCPEMVEVPGGPFMMGCNESVDDDCYSAEYPQHEVVVPGFEIDVTEVTASAYKACVSAGSCDEPSSTGGTYGTYDPVDKQDHPINYVSWHDASDYCQWSGKRLCTESEWEKAARGTDGRKYPWGNEEPTCDNGLVNFDWCVEDTTPVGSYPSGASPYGALDMAGNVGEWVQDRWHGSYEGAPTDGSAWEEGSSSYRVRRGGNFFVTAPGVRAGYRGYDSPGVSFYVIGFRCCRSTE